MTNVNATGTSQATKSSHISESWREHEIARYDDFLRNSCRPLHQVTSADLTTSRDAILTSLAQLASCQTKTERSLISLFDAAQQYIVAEATPTTSLVPNSGDQALRLCGTCIPRDDGVCDYTLRSNECEISPDVEESLEKTVSAELPVILVQDLATDSRFHSRPYCSPGNFGIFYAAVPIRSPRGINIGVLCVTNSVPGANWDETHSNILRGLSRTIMGYLENNRLKNVQKRNMRMSLGLQNFIDGSFLSSTDYADSCVNMGSECSQTAVPDKMKTNFGLKASSEPSFESDFNHTSRMNVNEDRHGKLTNWHNPFFGAASTVREALEIDGCAFLGEDSRGFHGMRPLEDQAADETMPKQPSPSGSNADDNGVAFSSSARRLWLPCQLLGSASSHGVDSVSTSSNGGGLSQPFLFSLVQRYPKGCLFDFSFHKIVVPDEVHTTFADHKAVSTFTTLADDSANANASIPEPGLRMNCELAELKQQEIEVLLKAFPSARSLGFVPIWDPRKGTSSIGGFIYSNTPKYEFDKHHELLFLRAVGILAAAEAFRLKTTAADRAKSDVLGSISHELRTPLHGITLGLELLNDSGLGISQQNIAHMIETCCRTLSETTEHLLDYSKVNNITESTKLQSNQRKLEANPSSGSGPPTRVVHLHLLVEDVMESIYAGHNYQHLSIAQLLSHSKTQKHADIKAIRRMDFMQATEELNPTGSNDRQLQLQSRDVSVFLLYDPSCAWQFRTVPGAIRRIVMNLFGNSLKYTARGVIKVSIDQSRSENREGRDHMITLTVEDTGSGISEEFLRNNIFKPFSQEDHLSTGTGLGLSVVQRIISQLGGSISITSQLDVGTKVTVSLPMMSETSLAVSELSRKKPDREQTTCYGLRAQVVSSTERLGADPDHKALTTDALMESLCCDYLGMKLSIEADATQLAPDVIILIDTAMSNPSGSVALWQEMPVLVICANALTVHQHESRITTDQPRWHEFVSQPWFEPLQNRAFSF
ncbi:Signal transduction histidine kinase-related protein, C-terminal [Fusarium oxysporum f. sp. vasinfectum]|nr:Signal transduction histidine kinase-related protein, C-terminal [Fusarium oxysporum f. sp. vasinfectum]